MHFYVSLAKTLKDDSVHQLLTHRKTELQERQKTYRSNNNNTKSSPPRCREVLCINISITLFLFARWTMWAPGIPRCIDAKTEADLPQDARFENEKRSDFEHSLQYA